MCPGNTETQNGSKIPPASRHAGDEGGMPAEFLDVFQAASERTTAEMVMGHPVWLNGADKQELNLLSVSGRTTQTMET